MIHYNSHPFKRLMSWLRCEPIEYNIRPYLKTVEKIFKYQLTFKDLSNGQLKKNSSQLKEKILNGIPPKTMCIEAFALVSEAISRTLSIDPYHSQIAAGLALYNERVIEMGTGEGKTLSAVFPVYLNALSQKGVHVMTFNDYLARRDAQWMGSVYEFLNLSVGIIQEDSPDKDRKKAYACDVTYDTAKQMGFDYLKDGIAYDEKDLRLRPFHYAIIDEADSIMIDEARVPLVIAGRTGEKETDVVNLSHIVKHLVPLMDYDTDDEKRNVFLTQTGANKIQALLGCSDLYDIANLKTLTTVNIALHAHALLHRDVDYIVRDNSIEMVDEFTGRVVKNRRWPHGIQSALEAKENIRQQNEGEPLGKMTLHHFFSLYPKLSGMTATAEIAKDEFYSVYGLKVTRIPENKPLIRTDLPDLVFTHRIAKEKALLTTIRSVHVTKRPILVGTRNVKESERIASMLKDKNIPCTVLNAKNDEREAHIIARAGMLGAITISTNMAGRGTDILLGGNKKTDQEKIKALGGLLVIGTHRSESLRVDHQLKGRSGRQGDIGASRFFISFEDDLLCHYRILDILPKSYDCKREDALIFDPLIEKAISHIQRIIEGEHFEIRKTLFSYASLYEMQRKIIWQQRKKILSGKFSSTLNRGKTSEKYQIMSERMGSQKMIEMEKNITLYHMDRAFATHLRTIEDIKEGVQLYGAIGNVPLMGGETPLNAYHKSLVLAFEEMTSDIKANIIDTFLSISERKDEPLTITLPQIDTASTWTYTINDQPFRDLSSRILQRIQKMFHKRAVA